jgi:hypothetical protein
MTYDQMMGVMQEADDKRYAAGMAALRRGSHVIPDRGLSINASAAERLMGEAGHTFVEGRCGSGAKCRVWQIEDAEVYVLVHLRGHPCWFEKMNDRIRQAITLNGEA